MRVTLIQNPKAGDEQLSGDKVSAALAAVGHDVRRYEKKKSEIERALRDPGDLVAIAGGDGTVKKVACLAAARDVPLTIIPAGTANNIAKTLGCLGDVHEMASAWRTAPRRRVDLGRVRAGQVDAQFLESVGGGLFAQLISRGESEVEGDEATLTGNEIDRALQLLAELLGSYEPRHWQIELDGRDLSGEYLAIEAMNTRFIGPNIPLASGADPSDGRLDLVLVGEEHRAPLLRYVEARLSGRGEPPRLETHRGERVRLVLPDEHFHVDDDLWADSLGASVDTAAGATVELSIDHGALQFVGPETAGG